MSILCMGSSVMDVTALGVPGQHAWREKQRIPQIRMAPGGDAVNQAIRLSDMGEQVFLFTGTGCDEMGGYLVSQLESRGVAASFIARRPDHITGTSVVLVSTDGERTIFSAGGAYQTLSAEHLPQLADPLLKDLQAVSIGSLLQMPLLESSGFAGFLEEARSRQIRVFADLASDKTEAEFSRITHLLPFIDYFMPSLKDALLMTGARSAAEAAGIFQAYGCANVIIKCGADGCFCLSDEFTGNVPAISVEPVDTTGAGDTMIACFIHGLLNGMPLESACRAACAYASYSTLFPGASDCKIEEGTYREWLASR